MTTASKLPPRVLIVDDEEGIRLFAARALQGAGYEVAVAPNGPTALKLVEQKGPFDLYVLDVVMPEIGGKELAHRLRQDDPSVKVLFFTGFSERLFWEQSVLGPDEAFIEKPVTAKGLLESASLLLFGDLHGPR